MSRAGLATAPPSVWGFCSFHLPLHRSVSLLFLDVLLSVSAGAKGDHVGGERMSAKTQKGKWFRSA